MLNVDSQIITSAQAQTASNFGYSLSYTPTVYDIFPAVAYGDTLLYYYGIHRIFDLGDGLRDMGDVDKMLVGSECCDRFDIAQPAINPNWYATINCTSSYKQEAGKYLVYELLTPGISTSVPSLQRTSFLQENYNFVVLPNITKISPQSGAIGGQQIIIIGSGFSLTPQNNMV